MRKGTQINSEDIPMSHAENEAALDRSLSRILSPGGEMIPSSGFAASVMERVQREAAMRAPEFASIPFPWSRALPGLIASFVLTAWMIVRVAQVGVQVGSRTEIQMRQSSYFVCVVNSATNLANLSTKLPSLLVQVFQQGVHMGAGWVLFALLFSWVTVQCSLYLADS